MNGYYNPVKIYQEPGCAARVGEVLEELGTGKRALLLAWNPMVFQQPAFAGLLQPSFSWEDLLLPDDESHYGTAF